MSDGHPWTFADYTIRDILDVDLVSTTYRVTTVDADVRRLRVFTVEVADDGRADAREAVITEAQRTRAVRHPHILATHEAGRHSDRVYVVSDDIDGAVLRDFIADRHPLDPGTALAMGWQLAEALDAVHASGNIHGTINPHTIWVADSPGSDVPMTYLTGFGSAQALAQYVKNQDGAPVCDDLLYVGPDQMRDQGPSPEADRYALACAVFHLMTGAPPYRRGSINALFGAHLFAAVEPPTAVRRDLPPALDSVFVRALAKQTSDRFPSAYALMIAVERALHARTGQAGRSPHRDGFAATGLRQLDEEPAPADAVVMPRPSSVDLHDDAVADGDVDPVGDAYLPDDSAAGDTGEYDTADDVVVADDVVADDGAVADGGEAGETPSRPESAKPWPRPSTALRAPDDRGVARAPGTNRQWKGDSGLTSTRTAPANGEVTMAVAADLLEGTGTAGEDDGPAGSDSGEQAGGVQDDRALDEGGSQSGTGTLSEPDLGKQSPATLAEHDDGKRGHSGGYEDTGEFSRSEAVTGGGGLASRLEARRSALQWDDDTDPHMVLPPRPPTPGASPAPPGMWQNGTTGREPASGDSGWSRTSVRELLETRRGLLMLVASALVVAVLGAAAVAVLRGRVGTQAVADRGLDTDAQPATIRPQWTTSFGDQPVHLMEVTDDSVLVAAGSTVGVLEPSSGAQRWSHRAPADVAGVAVLGKMVVVSTPDRVSGYEIGTGAPRWTLTGEVASVDGLVAGRERIYAVTHDESGISVSGIDPADGGVELLNTIADESTAPDQLGQTTLGFDASDKKGGPTLYVLTRDALHALDPEKADVRWTATVGGGQSSQEPHLPAPLWVRSFDVVAGASFVVGRDGSVCRYASDTGAGVWTACEKFPVELSQAPVLDARGGRVIVGSSDALAAYDFTSGQLLWDQAPLDRPLSAVASGPRLTYVAREEGIVQAIDHESGHLLWRAPDSGEVTALTADAEGVYVGAADGSVARLLEQNVARVDVQ